MEALLSKTAASDAKGQRDLSAIELDCGPKRVIEPSPQIPVDEELLTEQGDEIVSAGAKIPIVPVENSPTP